MASHSYILSFLSLFLFHFVTTFGANCAGYTSSIDCELTSECSWSISCECNSTANIDLCFAIDSNGNIGSQYFEILLDWLSDYVGSSLSINTRLGVVQFSTYSEMVLNFSDSETMSSIDLEVFISDMYYYGGYYTNTVEAIKQCILMYENESSDDTSKVFIIFTDGNPSMPNGGDIDVCAWASTLKSNDINTYIIGIGNNWNSDNLDCLVTNIDNDIYYIESYDETQFNELLPSITNLTCPSTYDIIITEVKVESDGQDSAVPFLEIYNPSVDITLSDLIFSGFVNGTAKNDDTQILPQGYYLVLYDATYQTTLSNVTCEECDCVHDNTNYCSKAIYIGCDGTHCSFPTGYDNKYWSVTIKDNNNNNNELSSKEWDSTFPDLSELVGYSYELRNKGYNNNYGFNWKFSCNIYGSPGSEPLTNCTGTCVTSQCIADGASIDDISVDGNQCDCDSTNHYYSDGCSCTLVPAPSNCYLYWRKNGSIIDYKFIWDSAETDEDHQYKLTYYVSGSLQSTILYARYKVVSDFDTSRGISKTPGYVQTLMNDKLSARINCTSITQAPTDSPTNSPTFPSISPSIIPSINPSLTPTNYPSVPNINPTNNPTHYNPIETTGELNKHSTIIQSTLIDSHQTTNNNNNNPMPQSEASINFNVNYCIVTVCISIFVIGNA